VREAVNMAIDRAGIAEAIYRKTGRAEYGLLSPSTDVYDASFLSYDYDPEGTKKPLAAALAPRDGALTPRTYLGRRSRLMVSTVHPMASRR